MIGQLRHRITILAPLQGRDQATGAEIKTMRESTEIWAQVAYKEVGSDERMEADQLTPMTSATVTIRYRQGVTTEMEVMYDGLKYKILSVLPDAKRCYLTLETVQVGAYREQSLTDSDGGGLLDGNGNALVFGSPTDDQQNYRPPKLTFQDG